MAQYKLYKIQIEGAQDYIAGVTTCLDLIESVAEGKRLLQAITTLSHQVFIQDTTGMPPYKLRRVVGTTRCAASGPSI